MREKLIEMDVLDCIIGIGANLFYNASMEACVIVCRKNKPEQHKGKVLFIDAKNEVSRKDNVSFLEPEHIDKIADAYIRFEDVDKFAKVVSMEDIQANRNLLSVQSYVDSSNDDADIVDVPTAMNGWAESAQALSANVESLSKLF